VTDIAAGAGGQEAASLREQLAAFRPLLTLSMAMTGACDESEILSIAAVKS
jgi:hypothetical protein